MTDGKMPKKPGPGGQITLQEIEDILADTGYSADQRKGWVKEVLTDLETSHAEEPSIEKEKLIRSVRVVVERYQESGAPMTEDVLEPQRPAEATKEQEPKT